MVPAQLEERMNRLEKAAGQGRSHPPKTISLIRGVLPTAVRFNSIPMACLSRPPTRHRRMSRDGNAGQGR